ncbi:hypothetical protein [Idiomarina loihiensis]
MTEQSAKALSVPYTTLCHLTLSYDSLAVLSYRYSGDHEKGAI